MKAISLWQPWATLVAIGAKKIETRSWTTPYRGPLAIHAARKFPKEVLDLCSKEPFYTILKEAGYTNIIGIIAPKLFPTGAIVAICELTAVLRLDWGFALPTEPELSFGDYTVGRYVWRLDNVVALTKPILATGKRGLWEI